MKHTCHAPALVNLTPMPNDASDPQFVSWLVIGYLPYLVHPRDLVGWLLDSSCAIIRNLQGVHRCSSSFFWFNVVV